jgi:hypothetical protein
LPAVLARLAAREITAAAPETPTASAQRQATPVVPVESTEAMAAERKAVVHRIAARIGAIADPARAGAALFRQHVRDTFARRGRVAPAPADPQAADEPSHVAGVKQQTAAERRRQVQETAQRPMEKAPARRGSGSAEVRGEVSDRRAALLASLEQTHKEIEGAAEKEIADRSREGGRGSGGRGRTRGPTR